MTCVEVSSTGITHEMRVKLLSTVSHSILSVVWRCVWHRKKILWDNWCRVLYSVHFYSCTVQYVQSSGGTIDVQYYTVIACAISWFLWTSTCICNVVPPNTIDLLLLIIRLSGISNPRLFWADSNVNIILHLIFCNRYIDWSIVLLCNRDDPLIVLLWPTMGSFYLDLPPSK